MKHTLLISRNLGGYLEGICEACYDVDYDGEQFYVIGGKYTSESADVIRDLFEEDHS